MTAAPEREIGAELRAGLHDSSGGYELVIGAIAAGGFGYLIDRAVGTGPLFMVLFAALGFVGATVSIYYRYRARMSNIGDAREARRTGADIGEATA